MLDIQLLELTVFNPCYDGFGLPEKEEQALAKMWLPAAQYWIQDPKKALLLIPAISTTGLFLKNLKDGMKKKKEKQAKEPQETAKCQHCSVIFKKSELPRHEKNCPKKNQSNSTVQKNQLTRMCQFCHNDLLFHEHGEHERNCLQRQR